MDYGKSWNDYGTSVTESQTDELTRLRAERDRLSDSKAYRVHEYGASMKAPLVSPGEWLTIRRRDGHCIISDSGTQIAMLWLGEMTDANSRMMAASKKLAEQVERALRDAETRLYMLPVNGEGVSQQRDILSAQIGNYREVLLAAGYSEENA